MEIAPSLQIQIKFTLNANNDVNYLTTLLDIFITHPQNFDIYGPCSDNLKHSYCSFLNIDHSSLFWDWNKSYYEVFHTIKTIGGSTGQHKSVNKAHRKAK